MAALMRLIFMFVLVFMIMVVVVAIVIMVMFVFLAFFIFLERTVVFIQSLVDDDLDFGRAGVCMVVVIYLENQGRFAFLDTLQVESPAAFPFNVEDLFVTHGPAEGMLVVLGARDFFFFVIQELDVDVFAQAIRIDAKFLVLGIDLAAEYAVSKGVVGPVKVPTFNFKMFVLVGRGAVAVAAGGKEYTKDNAEKGEGNGLGKFHFSLCFNLSIIADCFRMQHACPRKTCGTHVKNADDTPKHLANIREAKKMLRLKF